jgi:hypothetical protein
MIQIVAAVLSNISGCKKKDPPLSCNRAPTQKQHRLNKSFKGNVSFFCSGHSHKIEMNTAVARMPPHCTSFAVVQNFLKALDPQHYTSFAGLNQLRSNNEQSYNRKLDHNQ